MCSRVRHYIHPLCHTGVEHTGTAQPLCSYMGRQQYEVRNSQPNKI